MSQGLVKYPGVGCVVEFMQGNTPQIAWVLEEQNGKLRLLLPNRRETTLPATRLLPWMGPRHEAVSSRDAAVACLDQHKAQRDDLERTFDPLEWWELAQGEMERAPTEWFADLAGSRDNADTVAACGHALLQCKTHFKFQPPDFEINPREAVEHRLEEQALAQKREALVLHGSLFLRGLYEVFARNAPLPETNELDQSTLDRLRANIVERIATPDSTTDDHLWKQWTKGLTDDPFLPLFLAQGWGLAGPHHNIWLDRAGYDEGDAWSTTHSNELAALKDAAAQNSALPLNTQTFISIDNATTRDIDDAFAIEALSDEQGGGWRLTLALACPAIHWAFDEPLDMAVRRRATSVYLPEGVSHMLPEVLGVDLYSLLAEHERPALLITCEVATDGTPRSCTPSLARVRLAANLSYDAAEAVLQGTASQDNPALPFAEALRLGVALSEARQQARVCNGAVIIDRPELNITLCGDVCDPHADVCIEPETPAPAAHLLVSEQMILANATLARWAEEHNITLYHRTQAVDIPKEYAGIWTNLVDIARVVKLLAPACIETLPRLHAGVGETHYAPSTSPLRRYPDFINEAQVLAWLQTGAPRWSKNEMDSMLTLINARLDAASQAQRIRPRYWKLVHVRHRIATWWNGVITDENDLFFSVNLPDLQLFLRARKTMFPERASIGSAIEVRLGKLRPLQGEVSILEVRDTTPETELT